MAQQINYESTSSQRTETVMGRERPDLDPLGVRAGSFLVFPSIAVTEQFDDNVFATKSNKKKDLTTIVSPEIRAESDWNRHSLKLKGRGDIGFFKSHNDEDFQDYQFAAEGRGDIMRDFNAFGGIDYRRLHEQRSSPDDAGGKNPTEFTVLRPNVGVFNQWNRVSANFDGVLTRYNFEDVATGTGASINNDDRDRDRYDAIVRIGYEIVPEYEAFVRGTVSKTDYDYNLDDSGFNRDSRGFEVVAGARIDLTGVTFGDVFVGYTKQSYDDSRLKEIGGLTFGGSLTWNATKLTTVKGGIERSIEETTLAGASGYFSTEVGVTVDHELLRNLIVSANINGGRLDYQGNGRMDTLIQAGLSGRYLLNRNFYVMLEYDYQTRDSDAAGADFDKNTVMLRLQAQL